MSVSFRLKALAGAVALVLGGSAMANTSIDSTTTGDVFVNVVDNTNNTSFLYDTGISQASINGGTTTSYSQSLASDTNYQSFVKAEGSGDSVDYSVISATKATPTATVDFSSNASPSAVKGIGVSNAQVGVTSFLTQANLATSSSSNSAYLNNGSNSWGTALSEGFTSTSLGLTLNGADTADNASIGTALAFYSETSSTLRSTLNDAKLTTLAGTWDLTSNGTLTYTVAGGGGTPAPTVPLPTPLLLLLSGLGVMGVVARRNKPSEAVAV